MGGVRQLQLGGIIRSVEHIHAHHSLKAEEIETSTVRNLSHQLVCLEATPPHPTPSQVESSYPTIVTKAHHLQSSP